MSIENIQNTRFLIPNDPNKKITVDLFKTPAKFNTGYCHIRIDPISDYYGELEIPKIGYLTIFIKDSKYVKKSPIVKIIDLSSMGEFKNPRDIKIPVGEGTTVSAKFFSADTKVNSVSCSVMSIFDNNAKVTRSGLLSSYSNKIPNIKYEVFRMDNHETGFASGTVVVAVNNLDFPAKMTEGDYPEVFIYKTSGTSSNDGLLDDSSCIGSVILRENNDFYLEGVSLSLGQRIEFLINKNPKSVLITTSYMGTLNSRVADK